MLRRSGVFGLALFVFGFLVRIRVSSLVGASGLVSPTNAASAILLVSVFSFSSFLYCICAVYLYLTFVEHKYT